MKTKIFLIMFQISIFVLTVYIISTGHLIFGLLNILDFYYISPSQQLFGRVITCMLPIAFVSFLLHRELKEKGYDTISVCLNIIIIAGLLSIVDIVTGIGILVGRFSVPWPYLVIAICFTSIGLLVKLVRRTQYSPKSIRSKTIPTVPVGETLEESGNELTGQIKSNHRLFRLPKEISMNKLLSLVIITICIVTLLIFILMLAKLANSDSYKPNLIVSNTQTLKSTLIIPTTLMTIPSQIKSDKNPHIDITPTSMLNHKFDNCIPFDEIREEFVGKQICLYGNIGDQYYTNPYQIIKSKNYASSHFLYRLRALSDEKNQLELLTSLIGDEVYTAQRLIDYKKLGKKILPDGECIEFSGYLQYNFDYYYMGSFDNEWDCMKAFPWGSDVCSTFYRISHLCE